VLEGNCLAEAASKTASLWHPGAGAFGRCVGKIANSELLTGKRLQPDIHLPWLQINQEGISHVEQVGQVRPVCLFDVFQLKFSSGALCG
jgi:hypothetical protein